MYTYICMYTPEIPQDCSRLFIFKLYKQLIKGEAREEGTATVKRKWMTER